MPDVLVAENLSRAVDQGRMIRRRRVRALWGSQDGSPIPAQPHGHYGTNRGPKNPSDNSTKFLISLKIINLQPNPKNRPPGFSDLVVYHQGAMATAAQALANKANAQHSTGPVSVAGKEAVSANRLAHGLSSDKFVVLPNENPAEYEALFQALKDEHQPTTPTESFLVTELARAQWKLARIQAIEAELLFSSETTPECGPESENKNYRTNPTSLADTFRNDSNALLKLARYEATARRAWHKALEQLRKMRQDRDTARARNARTAHAESRTNYNYRMAYYLATPPVQDILRAVSRGTKPIPVHLKAELDGHFQRDPYFDPWTDRHNISKELLAFFEWPTTLRQAA